jgi:hypothetical protein
MDMWTAGAAIALVLLVGLWVPYFIWYIRQGKAQGHSWYTWWKPRGHSDIGPDVGGTRQTVHNKDEARGAHY